VSDLQQVNDDEENASAANDGTHRRPVWEKNKKKKGGKNKAKHKLQNKKVAAKASSGKKVDVAQASPDVVDFARVVPEHSSLEV